MTYRQAIDLGLSPVPINPATKRPPTSRDRDWPHGISWSHLQQSPATEAEIAEWTVAFDGSWFGVVCGAASGDLEVLDFDVPDKDDPMSSGVAPAYEPWLALIGDLAAKLTTVVETPSGGRHVYYRCAETTGNTKLAMLDAERVVIETRGRGGLVVAPPSDGYRFLAGDFATIPVLDPAERELLWSAARSLDLRTVEADAKSEKDRAVLNGELSVLDDFDLRASWEDALPGWTPTGKRWNGRDLWRRPGKSGDWSAAIGEFDLGERMLVFSTSTPLPTGKAVRKSAAYAYLSCNGDFVQAARELGAKGYGTKPKPRAVDPEVLVDGEPSGLPRIVCNDRQLRDVTDDALVALARANEPPTIFVKDGILVRLEVDEDDGCTIRPVGPPAMRGIFARVADWWRVGQKSSSQIAPPLEVVEDAMNLGYPPDGVPGLAGISACPVFRSDGTIFLGPGYDHASRWYVSGSRHEPFPGGAKEAADWLIEEVLGDFPFADDASRAHALALLILPIVRPAITGQTPMHLVDAPAAGTGKSLLVKACLTAALGRSPGATPIPEQEEELSKLLFALFIQGAQVVFLDNIDRFVKSPSLATALTTGEVAGRILGLTKSVTVKVRSIFCATSNNGKLKVDIARRSVWIRLDAKTESPEKRSGFKHPEMLEWVEENQRKIVGAAIAMVEGWVAAGQPAGEAVKGSFSGWSRMVGGILANAGVHGFLANDEELKRAAAPEDTEWAAFYAAWADEFGTAPVRPKELRELAEKHELLFGCMGDGGEKSRQTKFGFAIASRVGRIIEGLAPQRSTTQRGDNRFKLVPVVDVVDINPNLRAREENSSTVRARAYEEGVHVPHVHHQVQTDTEEAPRSTTSGDDNLDLGYIDLDEVDL